MIEFVTTLIIGIILWQFTTEAKTRRKARRASLYGSSSTERLPAEVWNCKVRLNRKHDKDVIDFLNQQYYPDDYASHLVVEDICGFSPYEEDSFIIGCLEADPRVGRDLRHIDLSFRRYFCSEAIDFMSSLDEKDRKDYVLSLVRRSMNGESIHQEVCCAQN